MPGDGAPVEADVQEQSEPMVVDVPEAVAGRLTFLTRQLLASVGPLLTPRRLVDLPPGPPAGQPDDR